MSGQRRYICGVPREGCIGGMIMTDQIIQNSKSPRGHTTREEAFKCMRRWLIKQGYTEVGSREFQLGDGPVVVLTKKSRYGGLMVLGKNAEGSGSGGKRFMPERRKQGNRGLIV